MTPGIIPCDLSQVSHDALCELGQELGSSIDKLDGLVHNASILGDRKSMAQTSVATWNQVMQVNVNAPFMLTQVMLPLLHAAPEASVVFTSSGVGRKGRAFWGAYATSKFATEGMMQVLADELTNTTKIRVNSLNPGAINTAMRRMAYPAEPPTTNPDPEALVSAWLYLMSDDSAALNGPGALCSILSSSHYRFFRRTNLSSPSNMRRFAFRPDFLESRSSFSCSLGFSTWAPFGGMPAIP